MTLHRLSHDGLVLLSKKRIAEPFAASSNGIYVIPTYAPYEIIQMNNLFEQTNSITYVQDTSFIASDASVTICAFTANNNGYCCSLIDKAFVSSTSIPPTSPDST